MARIPDAELECLKVEALAYLKARGIDGSEAVKRFRQGHPLPPVGITDIGAPIRNWTAS